MECFQCIAESMRLPLLTHAREYWPDAGGDTCGGYPLGMPSPRTGRHRARPCWRVWAPAAGGRIPRPGGGGRRFQSAAKLLEQRHRRLTGCLPPPRKMRCMPETCAAGAEDHSI
jgi:hypothetical protein